MTSVSDEDINKRIAEFMGDDRLIPVNIGELNEEQVKHYLKYVHSFDSLIPVLRKMLKEKIIIFWFDLPGVFERIINVIKLDKSPSRVLALAIYEVLEER